MYIASTNWVERSLVISVYSAKGNCFFVPFFERDFNSMLWLKFVVLASNTVGCQGTYPMKHFGPVVEFFGIGICFCRSDMSTHFVLVPQVEACEEQR